MDIIDDEGDPVLDALDLAEAYGGGK